MSLVDFVNLTYFERLHMSARKNVNRPQSFPWKVVFGVVSIIAAVVLLSNPNNSNSVKAGSSADQNNLGGFSLKK